MAATIRTPKSEFPIVEWEDLPASNEWSYTMNCWLPTQESVAQLGLALLNQITGIWRIFHHLEHPKTDPPSAQAIEVESQLKEDLKNIRFMGGRGDHKGRGRELACREFCAGS